MNTVPLQSPGPPARRPIDAAVDALADAFVLVSKERRRLVEPGRGAAAAGLPAMDRFLWRARAAGERAVRRSPLVGGTPQVFSATCARRQRHQDLTPGTDWLELAEGRLHDCRHACERVKREVPQQLLVGRGAAAVDALSGETAILSEHVAQLRHQFAEAA
jgi:hypothetical protein